VDENGDLTKSVSKNNPGIFFCENDSKMIGYWKAPELTAKTLKNNGIIMTDVGYSDSDGYFYVMGRRDDVIVSGGYKIAPYEIENAAMLIPGIAECVCVPIPDKILGSVPKLFVRMKGGNEFSVKKIARQIAEHLEAFKIPREICQIGDFPRVRNSKKINREELKNYDEYK
jgi:long-chain acyl-CoA synthetase